MFNNPELRNDEKRPPDLQEWLQKAAEMAKFMPKDDIKILNQEEEQRLRSMRRNLLISVVVAVIFLVALVLVAFFAKEKNTIATLIFTQHEEPLPVTFNMYDALQLRSIGQIMDNVEHGMSTFTPFIAAAVTRGQIEVVTNFTNPSWLAFQLRHAEIVDPVMIADNFFCTTWSCFHVNGLHESANFLTPNASWEKVNPSLVKVPLPEGLRFQKAEHCTHLFDRQCRLILINVDGEQHFADIISKHREHPPTIHDTGKIELQGFPYGSVVMAFRTEERGNRVAVWNQNRLAIVRTGNYPAARAVKGVILDVERDERVEIVDINGATKAVLVLKGLERWSTRVRISIVESSNRVARQAQLILNSEISAITALVKGDSFQICHIVKRDRLTCHLNVLSRAPVAQSPLHSYPN